MTQKSDDIDLNILRALAGYVLKMGRQDYGLPVGITSAVIFLLIVFASWARSQDHHHLNHYNITLLTFSSSNILPYALPCSQINAHYANRRGYHYHLLEGDSSLQESESDLRWVKVTLLLDLLSSYSAPITAASNKEGGSPIWAGGDGNQRVLVYLDADLMVLDSSLDIEHLLFSHPKADLLLAQDSLDWANTGFIIVRDTPWSRQALAEWWSLRYAPGVFCDQHALNLFSLRLEERSELDHIALLPPHTINSLWPALEHFSEQEDKVLHLMGELDEVRKAVATLSLQQLWEITIAQPQSKSQTHSGTIDTEPVSKPPSDYRINLHKEVLEEVKLNVLLGMMTRLLSNHHQDEESRIDELINLLSHFCAWRARQQEDKEQPEHCKYFLEAADRTVRKRLEESDLTASVKHLFHLEQMVSLLTLRIKYVTNDGLEQFLSVALELLRSADQLIMAIDEQDLMGRAQLASIKSEGWIQIAARYRSASIVDLSLEAEMTAASLMEEAAGLIMTADEPTMALSSLWVDLSEVCTRIASMSMEKEEQLSARRWCQLALDRATRANDENIIEKRLTVEALRKVCSVCMPKGVDNVAFVNGDGDGDGDDANKRWQYSCHSLRYYAKR